MGRYILLLTLIACERVEEHSLREQHPKLKIYMVYLYCSRMSLRVNCMLKAMLDLVCTVTKYHVRRPTYIYTMSPQ